MLRTLAAICLFVVVFAQNHHPPNNHHPHPTQHCQDNADCDPADCPMANMTTECHNDPHHGHHCVCIEPASGKRAGRQAAGECMQDSDCTPDPDHPCHHDEVPVCHAHDDPSHNKCACGRQKCAVAADCTLNCHDNQVAMCEMHHGHHDNQQGECRCHHA